ncbi:hypothetical protein [Glacieibacterium frigidum]|uniref:hypothetical protein n=1 Tax=Glacieibacterium frigidum TaxID=2593303 RepID=UPI00163DE1C8|nr:hypothetical protein [Glacieibacterium frigidum]
MYRRALIIGLLSTAAPAAAQNIDGVARMFQQFTGNDLRAMRLTERGFVRGRR